MRFFVPSTADPQQAESVYAIIRQKISRQHGFTLAPDRLYTLRYTENGQEHTNTVGVLDFALGEVVVAIFRADDKYLVCTSGRGVVKGRPLVVGEWSVEEVVAFAPDAP